MAVTAAVVALIVLAALGALQLALAAGAPLGQFAWGGQNRVLPPRLRGASVFAVVIYAVFALIIGQRAGLVRLLPAAVVDVGIWVVAAYLILGVLANLVSQSRSEKLVMTPIALLLCAAAWIVGLGL